MAGPLSPPCRSDPRDPELLSVNPPADQGFATAAACASADSHQAASMLAAICGVCCWLLVQICGVTAARRSQSAGAVGCVGRAWPPPRGADADASPHPCHGIR
jgi:hypothetical protein